MTTANIPGPRRPLYLAGARVREMFPVLPLIANEPLGVGALSYAGAFNIGVVAAGRRDELSVLAATAPAVSDLGTMSRIEHATEETARIRGQDSRR